MRVESISVDDYSFSVFFIMQPKTKLYKQLQKLDLSNLINFIKNNSRFKQIQTEMLSLLYTQKQTLSMKNNLGDSSLWPAKKNRGKIQHKRRRRKVSIGLLSALICTFGAPQAECAIAELPTYLESEVNYSYPKDSGCFKDFETICKDHFVDADGLESTTIDPGFSLGPECPILFHTCEQLEGPDSINLCVERSASSATYFDAITGQIRILGYIGSKWPKTIGAFKIKIKAQVGAENRACTFSVNVGDPCAGEKLAMAALPEVNATTYNFGSLETLFMSWNLSKLLAPEPSLACLKTLQLDVQIAKDGLELAQNEIDDAFRLSEDDGLLWVSGASLGRYSVRPRVLSTVTGNFVDINPNKETQISLNVVIDNQERPSMPELEDEFKIKRQRKLQTCTISQDSCPTSASYYYDHLVGVKETILQPTFLFGPNCSGPTTYSCTQTATDAQDSKNLCTETDANIVTFDSILGALQMKTNWYKDARPGTYTIDFGASQGGQTATCTVKLVLIDECQANFNSFTTRNPPSPPFVNHIYELGQAQARVFQWTWPQVTTQVPPDQVRCDLYMYLTGSKDGGAYINMDANRDVFHFMNNDWYMDKKQSFDYDEVGTWTFRYTIRFLYPNRYGIGIDSSTVTIDPAFTVQIVAPPNPCYPYVGTCPGDYTWTNLNTKPNFQPTFHVQGTGCSLNHGPHNSYACTTVSKPQNSNVNLCTNVASFYSQNGQLSIHGSLNLAPHNTGIDFGTYEVQITAQTTNGFISNCKFKVIVLNLCTVSITNCPTNPITHDFSSSAAIFQPQTSNSGVPNCSIGSFGCTGSSITNQIDLCQSPSLAAFDTSTGIVTLANPTTIGSLQADTYGYDVIVTSSAGTTDTCSFSLVIASDPCPNALLTLKTPANLQEQIYYLTESVQLVTLDAQDLLTYAQTACGPESLELQMIDRNVVPTAQAPWRSLVAADAWSFSSPTLTKKKSSDVLELGTYYFRYQYSLVNYNSVASGWSTEYIKYQILNPCEYLNKVQIGAPQPVSYDYTVGDKPITIDFPLAYFTVTPSLCGQVTSALAKVNDAHVQQDTTTGILTFFVGSWETLPTNANSAATILASDSSPNSTRRLAGAQTQKGITLATENLDFEVTLLSYPSTTSLKYTIPVNIIECFVSEAAIIVPEYPTAQVIDLDKEGQEQIEFELTPFESIQGQVCGFRWLYSVSLNSEFDLGSYQDIDFIELSTNQNQIILKAPENAVAQNGTVSITGQLATHSQLIVKQARITVTYLKSAQLTKVESIVNREPSFLDPLQPSYVFDITETATDLFEIGIGQIFDQEEDSFVFKTDVGAAKAFISLEGDESSVFSLRVDKDNAIVGNYTLNINVDEDINGVARRSSISLKVEIVNSTAIDEASKQIEKEVFSDDATVSTDQAIAKEKRDSVLFNSGFVVTEARVASWDKAPPLRSMSSLIKELNSGIRKPIVPKITNTGGTEMNYSSQRFIEEKDLTYEELLNLSNFNLNKRNLQSSINNKDEEEDYTLDDELNSERIIYGSLANDSIVVDAISVYIEASEMQSKDILKFSYKIEKFNEEILSLSLQFDKPAAVSSTTETDSLVIQLRDFRDKENKLIAEDQDIRQSIPNQIDPAVGATIASAGVAASGAVGASFSINIVLNVIMSASMNKMLSSIKNLQVMVHLCLLGVIVPANAAIFFEYLFEMIAFDPVDVTDTINTSFSLSDQEFELEDNFVQLGYESAFFVTNLGSLLFILAFQIAMVPVYVMIWKGPCCSSKVRQASHNQINSCFFNGTLAFIDGTFLVLVIMGFINIEKASQGVISIDLSFWLALITLITCFVEVIGVTYFFVTRFKQLDEDENKERCGYIYEHLSYKVWGGWALLYPLFYQMRFALIVIVTIFMVGHLVVQVLFVTMTTIAIMILLGNAHPFSEVSRNYTSLISEFAIIIVMDLLLISSDPALDIDRRILFGYAMIAILACTIILSQGSLLIGVIKDMCHKSKLNKLRNKNVKLMQERQNKKINETKEKLQKELAMLDRRENHIRRRINLLPMPPIREEQEGSWQARRYEQDSNLLGRQTNILLQGQSEFRQNTYNDVSVDPGNIGISSQQQHHRNKRRLQLIPSHAEAKIDVNPNVSILKQKPGHHQQQSSLSATKLIGGVASIDEVVVVGGYDKSCSGCILRGRKCVLCTLKEEDHADLVLDISEEQHNDFPVVDARTAYRNK